MKEYGSEYNWSAGEGFLRRDRAGLGLAGAEFYRSGRDTLKAVAALGGRGPGTVLLPALCCESMIVPFALNGCKVEFYRLREDLTGDAEDVCAKLRDGALLLYMRYFGIKPFEDGFLAGLRGRFRDILLVEDRTQDLVVPRAGEGFTPDAMLASVRKWAPLPEGGVLLTQLEHPRGLPDSRFGDMRREAAMKKDDYFASGEPELKAGFLDELHRAERLLDEGAAPRSMSPEYLERLEHTDFPLIFNRRRENIRRLRARLEPLAASGRLRFLTENAEDSTLYFPILLENRDEVQRRMAQKGIYCPVIWPQPPETAGICEVSERVTAHMLALMCDQRYDQSDMDFIADTLSAALN